MKNDVVRPTKKGFSDCKKICADYACSYCAYPTCHALADTGVYGSFWIYSFCHFWRFHAVAICIPKRVSISKSCDITMCHTIFTESDSFIKIHFFAWLYMQSVVSFLNLKPCLCPDLGTSDIKLFAFMFLIVSVFIGIYLPIQYKFGYEKTKFAFWSDYYGFAIYSATAYESGKSKLELPLYVFTIPCLWRYCPYWFAILAISASLSINDLR